MWQLYIVLGQGAVRIRTDGEQKCCLKKSGRHGAVNCHARSCNRLLTVRGAMGPHSLCTQHVGMCKQPVAAVWHTWSGSRTDPYRGCTKMLFAAECST